MGGKEGEQEGLKEHEGTAQNHEAHRKLNSDHCLALLMICVTLMCYICQMKISQK